VELEGCVEYKNYVELEGQFYKQLASSFQMETELNIKHLTRANNTKLSNHKQIILVSLNKSSVHTRN
jgi:hypothetical protein